jgi:hypothetical protein
MCVTAVREDREDVPLAADDLFPAKGSFALWAAIQLTRWNAPEATRKEDGRPSPSPGGMVSSIGCRTLDSDVNRSAIVEHGLPARHQPERKGRQTVTMDHPALSDWNQNKIAANDTRDLVRLLPRIRVARGHMQQKLTHIFTHNLRTGSKYSLNQTLRVSACGLKIRRP